MSAQEMPISKIGEIVDKNEARILRIVKAHIKKAKENRKISKVL